MNTPISSTETLVFQLDLVNTPNKHNDIVASADYVSLNTPISSSIFSSGNDTYMFEFVGFRDLVGDGMIDGKSFMVFEGKQASIDLLGRVSLVSPAHLTSVSVPAAIWLFSGGLVGLLGMRRKLS